MTGPLRHPVSRPSSSSQAPVDNNSTTRSTREQIRSQGGELHGSTQPQSDTVRDTAAGNQPNCAAPQPSPHSPFVATQGPLVANRSARAVKRKDIGTKARKAWVEKTSSTIATPTATAPVSGAAAEGIADSAHYNTCPIIRTESLAPSLNVQEVVLNTPNSTQIPLPLYHSRRTGEWEAREKGCASTQLSLRSTSICVAIPRWNPHALPT